ELPARMGPRRAAAAGYDPLRHDFVLIGGYVQDEPRAFGPTGDILLLDLDHPSGWASLSLGAYVQYGQVAIVDGATDRWMSFGGGISGAYAEDRMLDLSVTRWDEQPPPPVSPLARSEASAVYDSTNSR